MLSIDFDLAEQYARFPKVKVEDVQKIVAWVHDQPHMPNLSEAEVLLFYFACKCSTEVTKQVIDKNLTCHTHIEELFSNLNVQSQEIQRIINVTAFVPLPRLTPEGYRVFLVKLLDFDPSNYNFAERAKLDLLFLDIFIRKDGLQKGYLVVFDQAGATLRHLSRVNVMVLKKAFYYFQEALPIQLKGVHFINVVPFLDKFLAMCTPFMKKELFDIFHFHNKLEDFFQHVPLEMLPKDYGGSEAGIKQLYESTCGMIIKKHQEIIEYEKLYRIDEKLRPGKPKNAADLFGIEDFDLAEQYARFPKVKVEDVQKIVAWVHDQPHMPNLSEAEVLLFYFACKCSTEVTKQVIDKNLTCHTHIEELFSNLNVQSPQIQRAINVSSLAPLPTLTPEGYRVFMSNFRDFDASNFNFPDMLKVHLVFLDIFIRRDGLQKGYVVIIDQTGFTLGHLSRMNVMVLKKAFYYFQEALPIQLKGVHIINVVPFLDKILALCSPFIKKELFDILHFHNKLEDIFQYVPHDMLPKDYGGSEVEIKQLHERSERMMISKHQEIIEYEKLYRIDEKLRPGKPKKVSDLFGTEGNFKKLEID
uniref:CRAL-TRIO domain-containing protein n=1 Tax=Glossina morsitans morsitans TaxID=37546 RepID=A0A1B0GB51_GLOMM